jgi:hypothetical protein
MSEENLNIDPMDISDSELDPTDPHERLISIYNRKINELTVKLLEVTAENQLNHNSLHALIKICKERGFDPFPGEDFPFKKPVKELSREELIAKNKAAAERIEKTRGVDSEDKQPMPSAHVLEMKYATETPTLSDSMEKMLRNIQPVSQEREIVYASCKEPHDPYKDER